jgi:hypothetical protein
MLKTPIATKHVPRNLFALDGTTMRNEITTAEIRIKGAITQRLEYIATFIDKAICQKAPIRGTVS